MRLFFWKKKAETEPRQKEFVTTNNEPTTMKKRQPMQSAQGRQVVRPEQQMMPGKEYHSILPLKVWCEQELTPLAWSRIVIRTMPIIRDFSGDFVKIQMPTANTKVEKDLFMIFLATIEEIYDRSYFENQPKELV